MHATNQIKSNQLPALSMPVRIGFDWLWPLLCTLLLLNPWSGAQAATTYSWTGASSNLWSNPNNWSPAGVPANGDSLIFPAGAANTTNSNDLAGLSLVAISVGSYGYTLNGNGIVLTSSLTSYGGSSVKLPIDVQTNAITFNGSDVSVYGSLSGSGPITLNVQSLRLFGTHSYSGAFRQDGSDQYTYLEGASLPAASFEVRTLRGNGTIGALRNTINSLIIFPGSAAIAEHDTAILNTGSLTFNQPTDLKINLNGQAAGTGYDQLNVTGNVVLGNSTYLSLFTPDYLVPTLGQVFTLINNDGTDAIIGTFNGKPEGTVLAFDLVSGQAEFRLSYVGGDGNDVTLTCIAAPKTWTGASSNLWSDAGNWTPPGAPANGNNLVFPALGGNQTNINDLPAGTSFNSITFSGGNYTLNGNGVVLTKLLRSFFDRNHIINLPIDVQTNSVTVWGDGIRLNGNLSGSGPMTLGASNGAHSSLTLGGPHSYSGEFRYNGLSGDIYLDGASLPAAGFNVQYLLGNGTIGALRSTINFLRISPGSTANYPADTGILSTGDVLFTNSATLYMNLNGAAPGTGYDQLNVTGSVTLGNNTSLNLNIGSSFAPLPGQVFTLINNDGTDAISGTFNGMPEGTIIKHTDSEFQLSYVGGDGNDVTLTCTVAPKVWTGAASNLWSDAGNWAPPGVPVNGNRLVFPAGAANQTNTNDLAAGTAFNLVSFSGGNYTLNGNGIVLTNALMSSAGNQIINLPIDVQTNAITLSGDGIRLNGSLSGSGTITFGGPLSHSSLTLGGTHSYSGEFRQGVSSGDIYLDGASLPAAAFNVQYLLGSGTIGLLRSTINFLRVYLGSPTNYPADTGILQTGNVSFTNSAALYLNLNGAAPGTGYDQLNVTGTVTLGNNASLNLTMSNSFVPTLGQVFTLINNDGTDAISGVFSGRPEGSTITLNGWNFQLSYVGGTGNDVTLTSLNGRPASTISLTSSPSPSTVGQSVTLTATVSGSSGTPTGTVTFFNGTTNLGSSSLSGGVATLMIPSLPAGINTLTALYAGNATYGGSSSAAVNHTVIQGFVLAVGKTGTGNGTIISAPGGINCGTDCSEPYPSGTVVTLTATPAQGSAFTSWSGVTCNGGNNSTSTCTFTVSANTTVTATFDSGLVVPNDFNDDSKSDLLWRNTADGSVQGWLMNGLLATQVASPLPPGGYTVTHVADLNGDGKADTLIRHADGTTLGWLHDGLNVVGQASFFAAGSGWSIKHTADLNGDGKSDLIVEHTDGTVLAWLMDGLTVTAVNDFMPAGTGWSVSRVGDLNGDGKADLIWQNSNGTVQAWLMDGLNATQTATFVGAGTGWSVKLVADFNGDNKADLVWQNTDGTVQAWLMDGTTITQIASFLPAGTGWSPVLAGDIDGDGKADLFWEHTDGRSQTWLMNGLTVTNLAGFVGAGGWKATHLLDLNGDGKKDVLWKHTDGTVQGWLMNGLTISQIASLAAAGSYEVVPPRP